MTPTNENILRALLAVARPITLEYFRKDSCIATTRIAIEALKYWGITSEPLACKAHCFNAAMARHIIINGDTEPCEHWTPIDGSWGVGIGEGGGPGWDGHLVAVVPKMRALIDLSIDQASRPHRKITLEPLIVQLPGDWTTRENPIGVYELPPDDAVVAYHRIENMGYTTTPDWVRLDRARPIIGKIIKAMKVTLKEDAHATAG